MPIPLIPMILSGLVGGVIGGLARQPEINRLKKQVKILQGEIERLQQIVEEQDRQIRELTIRYKSLKAWQFSERARQGAKARGAVMHQWAFKEYVDLLCLQARKGTNSDDERKFFNAYESLLGGGQVSDEERIAVMDFVKSRHRSEIDQLITPSSDEVTDSLEATQVA